MIKTNYHTHTYHSNHASGTPEEYVKVAIENGLKVLGFSDHSPCMFNNDHISAFRMTIDEVEKYVNEINELKEKYKEKIIIKLGYEMEYYPKLHNDTIALLNKHGYDYLILGQHFTGNEYDGTYSGAYSNESALKQYVEQVVEGINTGLFSCVAHSDLINYQLDNEIYNREMIKICEAALEKNVPLEFNLLGFEEHRTYPNPDFWKIVSQIGNKVIIGCDAHSSDRVWNQNVYEAALQKLNEYGITTIDNLIID